MSYAMNMERKKLEKTSLCEGCALYESDMCENSFSIMANLQDKVDLLVIGAFPMPDDLYHGCFMSRGGQLIRSIISKHLQAKYAPLQIYPKVIYTYAVRCCPDKQDYKVSIETVNKCAQTKLFQYIAITKPKVILTLGIQAAKAIGLKESIGSIRGKNHKVNINGDNFNVIPTFHPSEMYKKQGKVPLLRGDIHKAIYIAACREDHSENHDVRLPTSADDIVRELKDILAYCKDKYKKLKAPVILAIDTETTSLIPWDPKSRMIAISLSHMNNYGLAFPWEHSACKFTEEEYGKIKEALNDLLSSECVKFTGHNVKFDFKWLNYKYGLKMPPFFWDSMLGEHLLWEEKTGYYNLKSLVVEYFPEYAAYEKELKGLLVEKLKEKQGMAQAEYKEKTLAYKEELLQKFLELDQDAKSKLVGTLLNKGILDLTQGSALMNIEYRNSKKEGKIVTKKYYTKVKTILTRVDPELLKEFNVAKPVLNKKIKVTFEEIDLTKLLKYAALDALCSRKLMALQVSNFKDDNEIIASAQTVINNRFRTKSKIYTKPLSWCMQNITMPASNVLTEMEHKGVLLNQPLIRDYIDLLTTKLGEFEEIIWEQTGRKFNLNANADLVNILYKELGYPIIKKSDKTGEPSVDANTLEELNNIKKNPFLTSLLSYRKLYKCKNTYLTSWLGKCSEDGKIHTRYNLNGTGTGRLSSSDPNLQNVPFLLEEKSINLKLNLKEAFLPDSEEFDMYELDISNAEMRVLCAPSQDPNLIKVFTEGLDIHCMTGSNPKVSKFSYEELLVNKSNKGSPQFTVRQASKTINFGVVYVIGPQGLQKQLYNNLGLEVSEETCGEYIEGFLDTYKGVQTYMNWVKLFTRQFGFMYSLTGRRRRFPLLEHSKVGLNKMFRQAINFPIQSTSSDLVLRNIINLNQWVKSMGGRIILTVHDSIVFQLPKRVTGVKAMLDEIIMNQTLKEFPWLPVPWLYDVGMGSSYGHCDQEVL